ncbi:MAG: PEP/pyruvate-binding domain-containing protein [Candidatus Aenigmatarchaeota archaeon]
MYVLKLDSAEDTKNVGIKASSLTNLIKSGLPVPAGFVITGEALDKFLKANKIDDQIRSIIAGINYEDKESVYNESGKIEALIKTSNIPDYILQEIKKEYEELSIGKQAAEIGKIALDMIRAGRGHEAVVVRSSPITDNPKEASFAGQLSYSLNVSGNEQIERAIKDSWASLFSAKAMLYRKAKRIEGIPLMGVIIQKMINSEKSGIMFTSDPVRNDKSKIIIDGSWGMGDSVFYGIVIPDNYIIGKENGEIIEKKISKKMWMRLKDPMSGNIVQEKVPLSKVDMEILDDNEIKKLCDIGKRIELSYNYQAQDVEWCEERNRVFIIQSRPIKSMEASEQTEIIDGKHIMTGVGVSPGTVKGKVKLVNDAIDMSKIEHGDIMVTKNFTPEMFPALEKAAGIVTDHNSFTGYLSLMSREFSIPCIISTEDASEKLTDFQEITIDALSGNIYHKSEEPERTESWTTEWKTEPHVPQEYEITGTELTLNLITSEVNQDILKNSDGVGLFRSEHILTSYGRRPFSLSTSSPEEIVNLLTSSIGTIARNSKPVVYRSLDSRTDEFDDTDGVREQNPIIGCHGIRRSVDQIELLRSEIEALRRLHSQGLTNVSLLLPFVTNVYEIRKVKEMITFPIKLGISIDTPAAAMNIEEFCKEGIDFVSINLGMLTQLTLGVDSENPRISKLYSESDPAVLSLVKKVAETCKKYERKVSVTSSSFDIELLESLIRAGIKSISTETDNFEETRASIARIERRLLLDKLSEEPKP